MEKKKLINKKTKINKKASKYKYFMKKYFKNILSVFLVSSLILFSNVFFTIPPILSFVSFFGVVFSSLSVYVMDNYINKKDKKIKKIDKNLSSSSNKKIPDKNKKFANENKSYFEKTKKNEKKNQKRR